MKDFRSFINQLENEGELVRISDKIDLRFAPALISKSNKAIIFENLNDYEIPLVGGLLNTRRRLAMAIDTEPSDIAKRFSEGISNPIPPITVRDAPVKEIIKTGDDVNLTEFPIPLFHQEDGGPYISGGVGVAKDPVLGRNAGFYRMMFRTKNETGFCLGSHRDLRYLYEQALTNDRPLEVAVVIGLHPIDLIAATYRAPLGTDEFSIAGGLRGRAVELVQCETIDVEVPADAEIVLEGEILPVGWTVSEGPFGEFTRLQGGLEHNPVFKIKAVTHRKNPLFYALHMPFENIWLLAPALESAGLRALQNAKIMPSSISALPGASCYFTLVAAISNKKAGEGKNALLALLSVSDVKMAIVVDDDIDIFNRDELDWALTFRMQADEDVIIIRGARGDKADPSVGGWKLPTEQLTTSAKLGIDATIPDGIPKSEYRMAKYSYIDTDDLQDQMEDLEWHKISDN